MQTWGKEDVMCKDGLFHIPYLTGPNGVKLCTVKVKHSSEGETSKTFSQSRTTLHMFSQSTTEKKGFLQKWKTEISLLLFLLFIPASTSKGKQSFSLFRRLQKCRWINVFFFFRLDKIIEWTDDIRTYKAHCTQKEAFHTIF